MPIEDVTFGGCACSLGEHSWPIYISNPDEELRRATARALNLMNTEMFRPYAHRMTPAAIVPVHTPQEAIEEATYAVRELGMKVLMIANHVRRPVPVA